MKLFDETKIFETKLLERLNSKLEKRIIILQDKLLHAKDEIRMLKRDNNLMWSLLYDFWDEVQPEVKADIGTRFWDIHDRLVDIGVIDSNEEGE